MAEPRVIWVDRETGAADLRPVQAVPALRKDASGWLWLDFPEPDEASGAWLRDVFTLPHTAIQDMLNRNHVSRVYAFGDSLLFLVLHRPEPGEQGHVHYLELDQFIAPDFLITTHGPHSEQVPVEKMLAETAVAAERLLTGKLDVAGPAQLAHTIVSRLCQAEERFVNSIAHDVGLLEQKVMGQNQIRGSDGFLDELFQARHALLTVHTMAAQSTGLCDQPTRASHRGDVKRRPLLDGTRRGRLGVGCDDGAAPMRDAERPSTWRTRGAGFGLGSELSAT